MENRDFESLYSTLLWPATDDDYGFLLESVDSRLAGVTPLLSKAYERESLRGETAYFGHRYLIGSGKPSYYVEFYDDIAKEVVGEFEFTGGYEENFLATGTTPESLRERIGTIKAADVLTPAEHTILNYIDTRLAFQLGLVAFADLPERLGMSVDSAYELSHGLLRTSVADACVPFLEKRQAEITSDGWWGTVTRRGTDDPAECNRDPFLEIFLSNRDVGLYYDFKDHTFEPARMQIGTLDGETSYVLGDALTDEGDSDDDIEEMAMELVDELDEVFASPRMQDVRFLTQLVLSSEII